MTITDTKKPLHLLIVDDNEDIRTLVSQLLNAEGYRTSVAHDGEQMFERLGEERPDLILLDVMLPGRDGFHLCRLLSADPEMPPVIMLTAKDEEIDRVVGLELGADDYIVKPFGRRELVARIKAVLRRAGTRARPTGQGTYRFASWLFNPASMELRETATREQGQKGRSKANEKDTPAGASAEDPGEGASISLSTSETELLLAFVQNPGVPLSRDRLLDLTKGRNSSPFDRSIDTHISRLRRKLRDDSKNPELIKTAWGVGYMLSCSVEAV